MNTLREPGGSTRGLHDRAPARIVMANSTYQGIMMAMAYRGDGSKKIAVCTEWVIFQVEVLLISELRLPKSTCESYQTCLWYLKEPLTWSYGYSKDNAMLLTALQMRIMRDVKIQKNTLTTDLTSIKFLCTMITKIALLFAETTPAFYRSKHNNYGTISSESMWKNMENRVLELYFVETNYQLANILTKALPKERFEFLLSRLDMKSLTPKTLRRLQKGEDE
ncbi:hypothetical protein Tco_0305454 [Tanacetum coccineum]